MHRPPCSRWSKNNFGLENSMTPTGGTAYRAVQGVKTRGWELEVSGRPPPPGNCRPGCHTTSRATRASGCPLHAVNQFSLYTSCKLNGSLAEAATGRRHAQQEDKT